MNSHSSHKPVREYLDLSKIGFPPLTLLGVGLIAGIICWVVGSHAPRQFAFSWLFAFTFVFTLAAGSLFWLLLHYAMDADWTVVVKRIPESIAGLFRFLPLAFVPVVIYSKQLFGWMTLSPEHDHILANKVAYLNPKFFWGRVIFYFLVFNVLSFVMRHFSKKQDETGNPLLTLTMRKICYAGIPLFALSLTFAAFDWLMGLDYRWFSTMWGVYIFAGSAWSSMALIILITRWLQGQGHLRTVVTVEHYHMMGKLLFAFTVFWAYIAFSQYFLIYYSNIPEETLFFVRRNTGSWVSVSFFIVIFHFCIPFLFLLTQPTKRAPKRLCFWAIWVLVMHAVDLYWVILPQKAYPAGGHESIPGMKLGLDLHLLDVLSLVALVSLAAYLVLRSLANKSLVAVHDPVLKTSINLKN